MDLLSFMVRIEAVYMYLKFSSKYDRLQYVVHFCMYTYNKTCFTACFWLSKKLCSLVIELLSIVLCSKLSYQKFEF